MFLVPGAPAAGVADVRSIEETTRPRVQCLQGANAPDWSLPIEARTRGRGRTWLVWIFTKVQLPFRL
jgi:hypothetical protein